MSSGKAKKTWPQIIIIEESSEDEVVLVSGSEDEVVVIDSGSGLDTSRRSRNVMRKGGKSARSSSSSSSSRRNRSRSPRSENIKSLKDNIELYKQMHVMAASFVLIAHETFALEIRDNKMLLGIALREKVASLKVKESKLLGRQNRGKNINNV